MTDPTTPQADPVYESSRRELKWILLLWVLCFVWVIGYCGMFGYQDGEQPLTTVIGMPSWVFWGIFLPWILASVASIWFALAKVEDHPLEEPSTTSVSEESDHG